MVTARTKSATPKPPPAPRRPEYISPADGAARWDVSKDTIRRLISSGQLTGYRLNNRVIRIRVDELDACFQPIPTVRSFGGAA